MSYRYVYLSKEFVEHRCTPNPQIRPAHWVNSVATATRLYPDITQHIPSDTPPETRVFHCPDCKLIGLAPGRVSRHDR